jgi:hypothetical protein
MAFWDDDQSIIEKKRYSYGAIAFSAMVMVLITLDIVGDYREGVVWTHLLVELLILVISLASLLYFGRLYYQSAQSRIHLLEQDLESATQQAQQWREANRELIAGLAAQIQKQFDAWQLTRAEAEVGHHFPADSPLSETHPRGGGSRFSDLERTEPCRNCAGEKCERAHHSRPGTRGLPEVRHGRPLGAFRIFS